METLTIIQEIAKILLLAGAFVLLIIIAIGLVKLFPFLRRALANLATTTESTANITADFATISDSVAGDLQKAAASAAASTEHLAMATASIAKITGDLATVSGDVASDLRQATASAPRLVANLADATGATSKIAGDFAAVSGDVADNLRKTTDSTAQTVEHLQGIARTILESSRIIRTAIQLLELLGPAGRTANIANLGINRIPEMLRNVLRRNSP